MALALIASPQDLDAELSRTVLGRRGFERQLAALADQARALALARRPDVVLVDVCLDGALGLVVALRADPVTRDVTIVALAGEASDPREVPLLKAGVNAVLRLPADPGWDDRLLRIVTVPLRKAARFPISFRATAGPEAVPATGLNVSVHGMLVETWAALELCEEVDLRFRLSGEGPMLGARGRVVRRGAPRQYGVEFIDLDGEVRQVVEAFVHAG